jgi:hypothetical protein
MVDEKDPSKKAPSIQAKADSWWLIAHRWKPSIF